MRTTVTLDPDVERLLQQVVRERGISFKQALNDSVRSGVQGQRSKKKFVQKSFPLGMEQYFRWEKALSLAESIEDEELTRKLSLRK